MNRRSFLTLLGAPVLAPAVATFLTACGDDDEGGITHPTGANDVVLRIGYEGGFVPAGFAFVNLPTLLISGDGRVFEQGAITLEFPGPLMTPVFVRSISDAGIGAVLQLAEDAGLLAAPPDYEIPGDVAIADAPTTVVTIVANGKEYRHAAYALGIDQPDGGPSTPARDNLQAFVQLLADLPKVAGAKEVGESLPFLAERYRFQAMGVDPEAWTDPAPTVLPWPEEIGVRLADAETCAMVAADAVGAVFEEADQLTFFEEEDVVYQLFVAPVLPGDAEC